MYFLNTGQIILKTTLRDMTFWPMKMFLLNKDFLYDSFECSRLLTLLHSGSTKLHTILAFLSAAGLNCLRAGMATKHNCVFIQIDFAISNFSRFSNTNTFSLHLQKPKVWPDVSEMTGSMYVFTVTKYAHSPRILLSICDSTRESAHLNVKFVERRLSRSGI